jgi:aminoglycoside phosphotransferase (APT) family kinase protein
MKSTATHVASVSADTQAPRPDVSVAAILGTMDDLDILPLAIDHLRAIGIRAIIALDFGSMDGSLDYLYEAEAEGDLWVIRAERSGGMRKHLARALDADRVIFLDADEFWLPATGWLPDLADVRECDVLTVMRFNVVTGADGPMMPKRLGTASYDDVLLHAQTIPALYRHMQEHPDAAWVEGQLEPKVLARPEAITRLHPGAHDVHVVPGHDWRRGIASQVLIAHLPFRSHEQFERKAVNVTAAIERKPEWFTHSQGWQWVRWAELHRAGRLREEYERQVVRPEQLHEMRSSGRVRSVADMFERPIPAYSSEQDYERATRRSQPWIIAGGVACRREGICADSFVALAAHRPWPTVLVPPDHMVQLYGPWRDGGSALRTELEALGLIDDGLPVPRPVAHGALGEDWHYAILSLVAGTPLARVAGNLGEAGLRRAGAWAGSFVRRLQETPLERRDALPDMDSFTRRISERLGRIVEDVSRARVLPPRLVAQLEDWMPSLPELMGTAQKPVLLHAELDAQHVVGQAGPDGWEATGVIDFTKARVGHPLYELGAVWLSLLSGDIPATRAFLRDAAFQDSEQPGFPRIALAWSLLHERVTLAPLRVPGTEDISSLGELAGRIFAPGEP